MTLTLKFLNSKINKVLENQTYQLLDHHNREYLSSLGYLKVLNLFYDMLLKRIVADIDYS